MKDINNYRQNHPELIVRDLEQYVPPAIVRDVLKYRGVNKWLRVRRLLIQLKSRWKDDIKELEKEKDIAMMLGDIKRYHQLQGYIEAMISCRQQVRALTHSPREVDFPTVAKDFGVLCELPMDFPARPHKRWFWRYDGIK